MSRISAALVASLLAASVHAAPENYTIDASHTYPNFAVSHLGMSTMYGQFASSKGTLVLDREAGSLEVTLEIDASSVYTGHGKRDDHLRSPDFLNVAEFPVITFESTGSKWDGDRPVSVTGNLTLLGVSRPVTLEVNAFRCGEDPWNNYRCGADATASIKRTDFGMNYGVPGVGDEMRLMFEVEALRD